LIDKVMDRFNFTSPT